MNHQRTLRLVENPTSRGIFFKVQSPSQDFPQARMRNEYKWSNVSISNDGTKESDQKLNSAFFLCVGSVRKTRRYKSRMKLGLHNSVAYNKKRQRMRSKSASTLCTQNNNLPICSGALTLGLWLGFFFNINFIWLFRCKSVTFRRHSWRVAPFFTSSVSLQFRRNGGTGDQHSFSSVLFAAVALDKINNL